MCKWRDFFIMVRKGEDPWRKQHEIRERETSTSDIKKKEMGLKDDMLYNILKKKSQANRGRASFFFR